MKHSVLNSQSGISLVEILVVVVISGILVTFSVAQFGRAKNNFVRQNIAREFKTSLERARFDSVKRHAVDETTMAEIRVISTTSYMMTTDLNQNGTIESTESRTVDFSVQQGVTLLLPAGRTAPVSIVFDERGHATVEDFNGLSTDHFLFCDAGCTLANATNQNSSVVYISATGTVAMLGGGDAVPSISAPSLSTVANTSGINPDLTEFTGTLPTPTPNASPSVTPTPATPTPTPISPTPTPTGTPTPTPSLPSCFLNQRPGNPAACRCDAPWFVAKSGKCGP